MAGRGKAGIPHPTPLLPTYVEGHWHLPKPTINGVSPVTGLSLAPVDSFVGTSHHIMAGSLEWSQCREMMGKVLGRIKHDELSSGLESMAEEGAPKNYKRRELEVV
ncbi:hypothetical protein VD0001_g3486 [Verticillium dahliae]|nr:hypothetical protein VD0001_g3486 [Verticillium dahliae]